MNWLAYPKHPIFKNRGTMHPYGDLLGVISYASYKSGFASSSSSNLIKHVDCPKIIKQLGFFALVLQLILSFPFLLFLGN